MINETELINKSLSKYGMAIDSVTKAANATIYKAELNPEHMIRINNDLALLFQTILRNPKAEVYAEAPYLIIKNPEHNFSVDFNALIHSNDSFMRSSRDEVDFRIGINENREPFSYSLREGHMIVAGTTGSGKSELLHTIINSLYVQHNADIEVFGVDVAKVGAEFAYYGENYGNFHLIDTIEEAFKVFEWLNEEMNWRFHGIRKAGYRNALDFNKANKKYYGHIFVIVDELADLMLEARKKRIDLESKIVHIAQVGRACGIHLILATQSPRKEVVTGLIKANCDTKIALTVASATESCIILGHGGAEKLNGKGDMIVHGKDGSETRVQGALVSQETKEWIMSQRKGTVYKNDYMEGRK